MANPNLTVRAARKRMGGFPPREQRADSIEWQKQLNIACEKNAKGEWSLDQVQTFLDTGKEPK